MTRLSVWQRGIAKDTDVNKYRRKPEGMPLAHGCFQSIYMLLSMCNRPWRPASFGPSQRRLLLPPRHWASGISFKHLDPS